MKWWRSLKRGPLWTALIVLVVRRYNARPRKPEWVVHAELWCAGMTRAERRRALANGATPPDP